jgi:glycosyltransferase involved in cell wall biosynthesis
VSIVVPIFNERPELLRNSLESLQRQTFAAFECLIIDDSTERQTSALCESFCILDSRFKHIHPPARLGLAASLNLGIQNARGLLIARHDGDDESVSERLELQMRFLTSEPNVDVLGGNMEIVDRDAKVTHLRHYPTRHSQISARMHFTTAIAHPTVMMRRASVVRAGGYRPEFRYSEDLDLWLRLLNAGARFANLDAVLVRYRQPLFTRPNANWRLNLKARIKNFGTSQLLLRIAGIIMIAIFACIPTAVQAQIYRRVVLRSRM